MSAQAPAADTSVDQRLRNWQARIDRLRRVLHEIQAVAAMPMQRSDVDPRTQQDYLSLRAADVRRELSRAVDEQNALLRLECAKAKPAEAAPLRIITRPKPASARPVVKSADWYKRASFAELTADWDAAAWRTYYRYLAKYGDGRS
jgi:hypothetical protein